MVDSGKAQILPFTPPVREDVERAPQNANAVLRDQLRIAEAILFASAEPVSQSALAERLPGDADVERVMEELQEQFRHRGVNLVKIGANWAFRTADDLGFLLNREAVEPRKLSRAALEVLAIVAYHQPVTRAEIEDVRGVGTSKGTLDVLLETGWVRMRGRRRSPGKPITYGTTDTFLDHFGLVELGDLPGLEELRGAGLLKSEMPMNFKIPLPDDDPGLREDEDPLDDVDVEALALLTPLGDGPDD